MYRCEVSGKLSQPNERAYKLVTKTRKREYFKDDPKTGQPVKIGEGFEIVEEKVVCKDVYDAATAGLQTSTHLRLNDRLSR